MMNVHSHIYVCKSMNDVKSPLFRGVKFHGSEPPLYVHVCICMYMYASMCIYVHMWFV